MDRWLNFMENRIIKLQLLITFLISAFCCSCTTEHRKEDIVQPSNSENNKPFHKNDFDIDEKLDTLIIKWRKCIHETPEMRFSSNTYDFLSCAAYQDIVRLGKPALPYIIDRIRHGDSLLWHSVKDITGVDLDPRDKAMSIKEITRLYINWWDAEGKDIFGNSKQENKN